MVRLAVRAVDHTAGARATGCAGIEGDAADSRAGDDGQVGARACGVEVGDGAGAARAVLLGHLIQTEALLLRAVEVDVCGVTSLLPGLDERMRQRVAVAKVGHVQWAIAPVPGVGAALVVLAALEAGQHRVPIPAVGALRGPLVVVAGNAAGVAHRVDRTRPAQHLAQRPPQRAVIELRLGGGGVVPVDALLADQLGQPGGHVDERVPIARAGFQQQHLDGRVFRQAVGEHAAGRTGADDDVVEQRGVPKSASADAMPRQRQRSADAMPRG